jgi:hypothetical protein
MLEKISVDSVHPSRSPARSAGNIFAPRWVLQNIEGSLGHGSTSAATALGPPRILPNQCSESSKSQVGLHSYNVLQKRGRDFGGCSACARSARAESGRDACRNFLRIDLLKRGSSACEFSPSDGSTWDDRRSAAVIWGLKLHACTQRLHSQGGVHGAKNLDNALRRSRVE